MVEQMVDSVTFPVSGGEYSQVCGRIKAYQWGLTDGFWGYNLGFNTIDELYFDGVAVMHGYPRQHIWTFAAGFLENLTSGSYHFCPCDTTFNISIPPFGGEDYFCEAGYVWGQAIGISNQSTHSTPMTLSGMVGTATPPAHVAHSIILRILPKSSTGQLQMTLN